MLISLVALVCVAMSAPAFASTTFSGVIGTTAAVTTVIGGGTLVPSTGVIMSCSATATLYSVTSVHNSALNQAAGKIFGAVSGESTIKYILAPSASVDAGTAGAWPAGTWVQ